MWKLWIYTYRVFLVLHHDLQVLTTLKLAVIWCCEPCKHIYSVVYGLHIDFNLFLFFYVYVNAIGIDDVISTVCDYIYLCLLNNNNNALIYYEMYN